MTPKKLILAVSLFSFSLQANGQEPSAENRHISWGGFIDGQFAYDFNNPQNGDRSYSTQPVRSNEFNINLAFLEAKVESQKTRARFAVQAGTSVQSNYSSEPTQGSISGGDLSRHIQEARIGHKLTATTWIDAGIFFAHVGSESFISKENITLTRSLIADYSPYYLSGMKLTHVASDRITIQFLVVNGWQNISENNSDKSIGTGFEYAADRWSFSYKTLLGQEVPPDLNGTPRNSEFRHFHDFILKSRGVGPWEWVAQFDIGFQKKSGESGEHQWQGASIMARYSLNTNQKVSLRAETYYDPSQVVVVTNTPYSLNVAGTSVGFDQSLPDEILWRTELRLVKANQNVFPHESTWASENLTVTTSWAMSF